MSEDSDYDISVWEESLNATQIFYRHDEFLPEQPLFMNVFFITGGLLPSRGISFTDSSGARFSFALVDDRKDGGSSPFFLREFRDGEIINGDTPFYLREFRDDEIINVNTATDFY
ncbi:MAG: hypothetical protein FWF81_01430 [Defluviitaleaceae bacterium]|nr:hypothetical protein [Defluviitaleaceae bacterium]